MAIEKKLICFKKRANFDTQLAAGNILDTSIVFIKDTQEIYTHGVFFSTKAETDEAIAALQESVDSKQDALTAGSNVQITTADGVTTISATDTTYTLSLTDNTLALVDGDGNTVSSIDLSDYLDNTDTTNKSLELSSDGILTLTDSAGSTVTVDLSSLLDNTDTTNASLVLGTDNVLTLTDSAGNVVTADLSSLLDNTDTTVKSLSFSDNILTLTDSAGGTVTVDLSSLSTTDTKNTAGATESSEKLYLVGATEQTENPETNTGGPYMQDGDIYNGDGEVLATESSVSDVSDAITTVNETLAEIQAELEILGQTSTYCLMVRTYGDSDPVAEKFYGSQDNISVLASHLKMAAIRGQGDYDMLADTRITLSEDGNEIAIDGSDGDIMCATDTKIYLYAEKVTATDGTLEIFGLGLTPITLFEKEAVGYDPFAIACDAAVYAQLTSSNTDHIATDDTRTQLHCIYNENIIGQYTAPSSLYTTTYKSSGAGYAAGSYSTLNNILHAQDKNEDDTTNYPYLGLYYRFVEIWMAAAKCELGTHDISATDLLGPGVTSTSIATSTTFADEAITAGSGVKVMDAGGNVLTVGNIYTGTSILDPDGTSRYCYTGMTNTTYVPDILPVLTPHRIIDKIVANGNLGYIGSITNVFDEDGELHTDIDVSTGDGMEDGARYYVVRDCPGAESFSDGVMTGVVNCYIKMTPLEGCTYSDGTDLTDGAVIFKLSTLLYRGLTWSAGHWIWMQGFHYVIHTDEDKNRYVTAIYQRDPSAIPAWNGGTYYCLESDGDTDYEEGYDVDETQLTYTTGWAKNCNPSVSMFYYPEVGGAQHTYNCAYTWRNNSYSGSTSAGYKSVNASAFGGTGFHTHAAAGSLDGVRSVASSASDYAASFALLDYRSVN